MTIEMQRELRNLLLEAKVDALLPVEFEGRLEGIYHAHLGADATLPESIEVRREALKRYEQIPQTIERHHQLELVAHTLGLDGDPVEPVADRS